MTRNLAEVVLGTIEIARADLIPVPKHIIPWVSVNSGVAGRGSGVALNLQNGVS